MPTVRELREQMGWSQTELAMRAGLSIHTIGAMEQGKPVQKSTLILVAHALMVKSDQITGVNVVNRVLDRGKQ